MCGIIIKKYISLFSIFSLFSASVAECPNIITNKMWGGSLNRDVDYINIPVQYVIIEHTVTSECNNLDLCTQIVLDIQSVHINNRYHAIGYNFLIGGDGNVYEGVGWHKVGAHAKGWNSKSLGIAFIGNFSDHLPSQLALNALKKLLACGSEKGELSENYKLIGHRQVSATLSPGTSLYQEITSWPNFSQDV